MLEYKPLTFDELNSQMKERMKCEGIGINFDSPLWQTIIRVFFDNLKIQEQYLNDTWHGILNIDQHRCDPSGKSTHQWKKYVGFTDTYEYCELCNKKRDN